MLATLPLLLALGFTRPVGTELWRIDLGSPLLAQPAVSDDGIAALLTADGLRLVDAGGVTQSTIDDVQVPFQPFWQGERLWVRTGAGWRSWKDGEFLGATCNVSAQGGAVDAQGRVLFAPPQELVACNPNGLSRIGSRRGQSAQVFAYPGGLVTADEWFVESFDAALKPIATRVTAEVGTPTAVLANGTILVISPGGRLDALDAKLTVAWKGPDGADGAPVVTRSGAILVPGNKGVSLIDPPHTLWSLAVPAGVRAAMALDDGTYVLIDRLGRVGVARETKLLWNKKLDDPGNILAPLPNGFVVQDGAAVVSFASAVLDRGSTLAVVGGPTRDHAARVPTDRKRCPPAERLPMKGKRLHLDGPAFFDGDRCVYPAIERECKQEYCSESGVVRWRLPCAGACDAAMTPNGGLVRGIDDKLIQTDPRGKAAHPLLVKLVPGFALAAGGTWVGVRTDRDLLWVDDRGRTKHRQALEKPWKGSMVFEGENLVGVREDGGLLVMPPEGPAQLRAAGKGDAGPLKSWTFGPMWCTEGAGVAGCALDGRAAQGLSLDTRATWFGEGIVQCSHDALCHRSAGATDEPFFKAETAIEDFQRAGDLLAVLVTGREVVGVSPIGDVRWRVPLTGKGECSTQHWIQRAPNGDLIVKGCGEVVAIVP